MKEFLELSDRFYKKFVESMFYRCTKIWCNKTKLITKREWFYCVCRSLKNRSQQIYFNSAKTLFFQSIKKEDKKEI